MPMKRFYISLFSVFLTSFIFAQNQSFVINSNKITDKEVIQNYLPEYKAITDSILQVDTKNSEAYRISGFIDIIQFRFSKVKNKLKKAISLDSIENNLLGLAEDYNILARYYKDIQKNDSAYIFYHKGFELSEKRDVKLAGRHLSDLQVIYSIRGQKDSAMIIIKNALELSIKAKDSFNILMLNKQERSLLIRTGQNFYSAKRLYNYGNRIGNNYIKRLANSMKGMHYISSKDSLHYGAIHLDSAIVFFEKTKNLFLLNSIYPSRASLASKDSLSEKKPIYYFNKQYETVKNTGHIFEVMTMINLSAEYYKSGNYEKVEKLSRAVINLSKKQEIQKILVAVAHQNLSVIYEKQKRYKDALTEYKELYENETNAYSTRVADQANKYKIEFETQKKEKENLQLKAENAEQELLTQKINTQRWYLFLFSIIAILSLIFYVKYSQNKRKLLLNNSRLEIMKAKLNKQEEIGIELHDGVAKNLESVSLKLDKEGINSIAREIKFIKEKIRKLSRGLSIISFEESSFEEQIVTLVSDYQNKNLKIAINGLDSVNWNNIENPIKHYLLFIIREAVSNSYNYSKANNIFLEIKKLQKEIIVKVEDDGIGFDVNNVKLGNGIRNMKSNVLSINGKIMITSEINKGTQISISFGTI